MTFPWTYHSLGVLRKNVGTYVGILLFSWLFGSKVIKIGRLVELVKCVRESKNGQHIGGAITRPGSSAFEKAAITTSKVQYAWNSVYMHHSSWRTTFNHNPYGQTIWILRIDHNLTKGQLSNRFGAGGGKSRKLCGSDCVGLWWWIHSNKAEGGRGIHF